MMASNWLRTKAVRRIMFLAVTFAPIAVLLTGIALPIHDHFVAQNMEIARQIDLLARLKGIANYQPERPASDQLANGNSEYLSGPNEGVATAKLQARLKMLTQASGARLQSVQGLPPENEGALRLLGAQLNLAGPLPSIHRIIFSIENERPYVFIKNAIIKNSRLQQRHGGQTAEPMIEAVLDVFSAFKSEETQ